MKLWQKKYKVDEQVEAYTVAGDYILDKKLVECDCKASIAHAKMLKKIGILQKKECDLLVEGLKEIIELHKKGKFKIKPEDEDCHTAIENYLTSRCGDVGKKIHTARSRNDQVLTAIRLYEKEELKQVKTLLETFKKELQKLIKKFGSISIPGYTHMRKAMPTNVKMWVSSFCQSVDDNLFLLAAISKQIDKSPLGSGAGFGISTIKLDTKLTAWLMGFSKAFSSPMHIQTTRGKFESTILHLLSLIMFDLNKFATDLILFSMPEFGFVTLPQELCTGSSIMPQKKNPDLLEIMRAYYHVVCGNEFSIKGIIGNLMSGYNRDLQLIKKPLFESLDITKESLQIASLVAKRMLFNKQACKAAMTKELYAAQDAYKLVLEKGIPFRDAYKKISKKYEEQ